MPLYYFDIETTGIEPGINMLVTIQYAKLTEEFDPISEDLEIFGVWEFKSERDLIKMFLEQSRFFDEPFTFIPVGVNLLYDIIFLYTRARHYKLVNKPLVDILRQKPFIDLKPMLVIINNTRFEGYNRVIDKHMQSKIKGSDIPYFYARGEYDSIVKYVKDEYQATLKVLKQIRSALLELQLAKS